MLEFYISPKTTQYGMSMRHRTEGRLVNKNWVASSCDLIHWHLVCLEGLVEHVTHLQPKLLTLELPGLMYMVGSLVGGR